MVRIGLAPEVSKARNDKYQVPKACGVPCSNLAKTDTRGNDHEAETDALWVTCILWFGNNLQGCFSATKSSVLKTCPL